MRRFQASAEAQGCLGQEAALACVGTIACPAGADESSGRREKVGRRCLDARITFDQDAQFVDITPQSRKYEIAFLTVEDSRDRMPDGLTRRLDRLSEGA
ncbi:hypothetical protein [Methylobacterium soli]|uniref:Uncharacterized protein n=1 Tax=Methylobacterium soli TaxID=553447 RepID=A0A6L3SWB8_9HYPH|nr:hypothetical protein [Methylobacterium soli]KAB1077237.1 hypothetical protein F6X53_19260 [Methylobacterium soli]